MAITRMESFIGTVQVNEDIMPLIWQNIKDKIGVELSQPLKLRHVTIFDEDDGNEYEIDSFVFAIKNGAFSSPLDDKLGLLEINSIIPRQTSNVEIYYLR